MTHETAEETSLRYEGWRVATASSVGVFVSFASLLVYTFGIFLKPLAEEFSWSREAVSAAFGVAAMTVAVCSPPLGYLLDRFSPQRIIVPCLIDLRVCVRLAGTPHSASVASLRRLPDPRHRRQRDGADGVLARGLELVRSPPRRGAGPGALGRRDRRDGAAPLAEALIQRAGWRGASVALGAMVLILGVPTVARFVRERPSGRHTGQAAAAGSTVRDAIGTRAFWILVTVLFCSSIAQNGALAHMSALLTDRGVSAAGGALALSAMGGASLVGRLMTGWMLDRFFAARVSFGLLSAAALGTFLLSGADSLAMGVLAAVLIGLGMGGEADVTPYLISRYFGLRSFSVLYGLTWTFYAFAGAIGPVLMGKAFDVTGSYEALLAQLALVTLAVAALMLFLPRYAPPRPVAVVTPPGSRLHPRRSDGRFPYPLTRSGSPSERLSVARASAAVLIVKGDLSP